MSALNPKCYLKGGPGPKARALRISDSEILEISDSQNLGNSDSQILIFSDSQIIRISDSQNLRFRIPCCRNAKCPGAQNGSPWLATGSQWVEMNRTAPRKLLRYLPGPRVRQTNLEHPGYMAKLPIYRPW